MSNLRVLAEQDLAQSLEGDFGIAVSLIAPDGLKISETKYGLPLKGRVLWSQPRTNLATGEVAIVPNPVVVLRRSSLSRIPLYGENWAVIIPNSPLADAPLETYLIDKSRAIDGGKSLGTIRLPLMKAIQVEKA